MLRGMKAGGLPVAAATHQEFEVGYVDQDNGSVRIGPTEAADVRFESMRPVRSFPSFKRQRHFPGLWWSATAGRHVGYESWLERDHLMMLDFDPDVVGIASQPFWLFWTDNGRSRCHAPDYFTRMTDGTAQVIDVRPTERIKPRDERAFEVTAAFCEQLGWGFRRVGVSDAVLTANVRWLAGYRHPRHDLAATASALRSVFSQPASLLVGAQEVGDPIAVLPVLFHLMWRHELIADLSVALDAATIVRAA